MVLDMDLLFKRLMAMRNVLQVFPIVYMQIHLPMGFPIWSGRKMRTGIMFLFLRIPVVMPATVRAVQH